MCPLPLLTFVICLDQHLVHMDQAIVGFFLVTICLHSTAHVYFGMVASVLLATPFSFSLPFVYYDESVF